MPINLCICTLEIESKLQKVCHLNDATNCLSRHKNPNEEYDNRTVLVSMENQIADKNEWERIDNA